MRSSIFNNTEVNSDDLFTLQNSKLLRANVHQGSIQAKKGSMVAYQGQFQFEASAAGGLGKFLKKAVTGEGQDLMTITGTGQVFLADYSQEVHLVYLENESMACNGEHVLAIDGGISHSIERIQGASSVMAGGFYNMQLQGTGWVALISEGQPIVLNTAEAPTYVDPQALVCWSPNLKTTLHRDFSGGVKNMLRGGSGESFQMGFEGDGWVIIQPSEGMIHAIASQIAGSSGGSAASNLGGLLG